jgi:hypothetical protein
MNSTVIVFVLVAIAINSNDVGGPPASQTIRYYDTAGECQTDLVRLHDTINKSLVRLDCKPLRISK